MTDDARELAGQTAGHTRGHTPGRAVDQARAPVIRFRLDGTSRAYDPARQAIRPDLADIAEAASHFAPHYAAPLIMRTARAVDLRAGNSGDSFSVGLLAAGARFAMLDATGGWAWGYALDTHSVGYVVAADLIADEALADQVSPNQA